MKYGLYSIKDKETGFMSPIIDPSDGAAKRNFSRAVNSSEGVIPYSPGDFDLFKVADFDAQTGQITPVWPVRHVCNGLSLVGEKTTGGDLNAR